MKQIKRAKDINGTYIKKGDLVTIENNFTGCKFEKGTNLWEVVFLNRRQGAIEVMIENQAHGTAHVDATDLVSEM